MIKKNYSCSSQALDSLLLLLYISNTSGDKDGKERDPHQLMQNLSPPL